MNDRIEQLKAGSVSHLIAYMSADEINAQEVARSQEIQHFFAQKATIQEFLEIMKLHWPVAMELARSQEVRHFFAQQATVSDFIQTMKIAWVISTDLARSKEIQHFFAQQGTVDDFLEITNINWLAAMELAKSQEVQHFFVQKATIHDYIRIWETSEEVAQELLNFEEVKSFFCEQNYPNLKNFSKLMKLNALLKEYDKDFKTYSLDYLYSMYFKSFRESRELLIKIETDPDILPLQKKTELMRRLDNIIDDFKSVRIQQEETDICLGFYQDQVYHFTYWLPRIGLKNNGMLFDTKHKQTFSCMLGGSFTVYPLMDQLGLRCTASVQDCPDFPLEIQINFYGTLDFASALADLDRGGPGQESIRLHEKELLKQVNHLIYKLSLKYPRQSFRLKVAGHSLGGALAKNFAHSLQRAIAIQDHTPLQVTKRIQKNLKKSDESIPGPDLIALEAQLAIDKANFKDSLKYFKKIEGITVYALAAPGVSIKTDKEATLLTYYHDKNFLRVYHHFHEEDIIQKFGDCEFLSGKNGNPRIAINKAIQFNARLTEEEIKKEQALPFPGITKRVMAAHKKMILELKDVSSQVSSAPQTPQLSEKLRFSKIRRQLYKSSFEALNSLASIPVLVKHTPFLQSWPAHPVASPDFGIEERLALNFLTKFKTWRVKEESTMASNYKDRSRANALLEQLKNLNHRQRNQKLSQFIHKMKKQVSSQIEHNRSLKNFIAVMEIRLEKEQNELAKKTGFSSNLSNKGRFFSKKEASPPISSLEERLQNT